MNKTLGLDSPLMNALNKVLNIVILNFCFLLTCIPVVTAGAGLTAMYNVNLKMVKNEENYVFKSFWKEFRSNFKQSLAAWLIMLALGTIFAVDFYLIYHLTGTVKVFFQIGLGMIFVLYIVELLYLFPYMARFQDTLKICFKNALIIGGVNIGTTITLAMIFAACISLTIVNLDFFLRAVFIWIVGGFGLLSYIYSFFLRRVFSKYSS